MPKFQAATPNSNLVYANESKNHLFDFYSSGRNCYYCKCRICSALLLQNVTE